MAIAATNAVQAAYNAGADPAQSSRSASEDRFLKLLVTQLRNQDPLNPLDNAQVTTQLAQLSTVTGIEKMNATLGAMVAGLAQQQGLAAAGLVGKRVAVEGDMMVLAQGAATGGYSLEQNAEKLVVTVTDATGKVVRTLDLGASKAGLATFAWDGKDDSGNAAADGDYRFSVAATAGGNAVAARSLTVASVLGVIPASDGFALNLGSAGVVPFGAVAQIL